MIKSKPYFKNIPHIGDLTLEFVIFEYECPILFVCKDCKNNMFLCVCCDLRGLQRWIMAPVNKEILIDLLSDKISIRDAFGVYKSEGVNRYLIEWKREYGEHFKCKMVKFEDLPDEDLPVKDEFIEAEDDEYKDIILQLKADGSEKEVLFSEASIVNDFEYETIKVQKFKVTSNVIDAKTIIYNDVNNLYFTNTFEITEAKPLIKQVLIPSKSYKFVIDMFEKESPILFSTEGLLYNTKLEGNCYVYGN